MLVFGIFFHFWNVSLSYLIHPLKRLCISAVMWVISIGIFTFRAPSSCSNLLHAWLAGGLRLHWQRSFWRPTDSLSCHSCLPRGGMGQSWATSTSHISHTPAEPSYLFDEGCCLQAAFAISHLVLELLPQLLQVVCLPQDVVLTRGVLLAELPAPPHHICTYGPVWIALRFKSLGQGQETCQHSSLPTSQEKRVPPTLMQTFLRAPCLSFHHFSLYPHLSWTRKEAEKHRN